jgi:hypothetical protein
VYSEADTKDPVKGLDTPGIADDPVAHGVGADKEEPAADDPDTEAGFPSRVSLVS